MKFPQFRTFHSRFVSLFRTRSLSTCPTKTEQDLKVCIVGAGPAGLYTADRILKQFKNRVKIDVIDRLRFPFGLVETGVAPDHPSTKNVIHSFHKTLISPQCCFYGGVQIGHDLSLRLLQDLYHAVVLAYGAEADRRLNVVGEEGGGVFSAREFVWWYNGHPDYRNISIPLDSVKTVGIIGAGNVALDCARILLKPWTEFQNTDLAPYALQKLQESAVEDVFIIARRSPAFVNFTPKELREIFSLPSVNYDLELDDFHLSKEELDFIEPYRRRKRIQSVFRKAVFSASEAKLNRESFDKTLHFLFKKRIQKINLNQNSKIESIDLVDTSELEEKKGSFEVKVDLLITSLGNRSVPIEGVAFDEVAGVVPNLEGRVLVNKDSEDVEKGLYVSGWLKRGASGIIGTNIVDAEEVTHCLYIDAPTLLETPLERDEDLANVLEELNVPFVGYQEERKIKEEESESKNFE